MSFDIAFEDSTLTSAVATSNRDKAAAAKTKHLGSAEHAYKNPGMYIGEVKKIKRKILVLDETGQHITRIESNIPPGLERIIVEAIANICDHTFRSREGGCDPGSAIIEMGPDYIKFVNFGLPMDIVMNEFGRWVPSDSFGKLRTGTNFNTSETKTEAEKKEDEKKEKNKFGGCHGLGIKLASIFSDPVKGFHVRVVDETRQKSLVQSWYGGHKGLKDNLSKPVVSPSYGERSQVMVVIYPNFKFFGYNDGVFPPEMYHLVRRHAADASFTAKTPFVFNGLSINFPTILDYARLSFPEINAGANYLIHYEWEPGTPVVKNKDGTQYASNGSYPSVEMIMIDAPNKGRTLGFANSIINVEGGIHVDAAIRAITGRLVNKLNAGLFGKKKKKDDDDETKEKNKDKPAVKITMRDIRPMFGLITANRLIKPFFPGQCKDKMTSCGEEIIIKIGDKKIAEIDKWNLGQALHRILGTKRKNLLAASNGKKTRFIGKISGTDANDAGDPVKWKQCTAVVFEGKSAENYFTNLVGVIPGGRGRDILGGLSIRGKVPNAHKATIETIAENKEFKALKTMLGLEEELDYTIPTNQQRLRYGSLMIMTDADLDGFHIKGLILAYFHRFYPSLLKIGFVQDYRTPILRAYKNGQVVPFFLERDYEEWKAQTPDHESWKYKRFKGLGSSVKEDVIQDFQISNIVNLYMDPHADFYILLAFGKDTAEDRRKWLASYDPNLIFGPIENKILPVSRFFTEEFIQFGRYCIDRHLPGPDGLNLAMRKSIYGAMLSWGTNFRKSDMKMCKFVSDVSNDTGYDHGDALGQVITRMCGDFVGFQNVPYFIGKGMTGSRDKGGKDAASVRYLGIEPNSWFLKRVFNPIDFKIAKPREHNNTKIEPKFFLPIIPLHLVQGAIGISYGWSSFWPAHNMLEVIDYLIARNNQEGFRPIIPAYRGFTGDIQITDDRKKIITSALDAAVSTKPDGLADTDDEYELPVDPIYGSTDDKIESIVVPDETIVDDMNTMKKMSSKTSKKNDYTMLTRGVVNNLGYNHAIVVDLPVGYWIDSYRKFLIKLRKKGIIEHYRDLSDESKIYFEITGFNVKNANNQPRCINMKDLGLERYFSLNKLVLLDEYSRPMKFNTLIEAFDHFYIWRLTYYIQRRELMIVEINNELIDIDRRFVYMEAILSKKLRLTEKGKLPEKTVILEKIKAAGFDSSYYGSVKITADYHRKLTKRREELIVKGNQLTNMYPQQLWNEDLIDLRKAYVEKYGEDVRPIINDNIQVIF